MDVSNLPNQGLHKLFPREWNAWIDMRKRCLKQTHKSYTSYGGRGITICDRWKDSFRNFLSDMGPKPKGRYSLDRAKNNEGYSPENCRWTTDFTQQRNTRRNVFVTYNGTTKCLSEWEEATGIPAIVIWTRLRRGWTPEDAVSIPSGARNRKEILVTRDGRTQSITKWAKELGIRYALIQERKTMGWTLEDALFTPVREYGGKRAKKNQRSKET